MHFASYLFFTALVFLSIQAHPHAPHHHHVKRVDYSNPAMYAGIDWKKATDWSTVDYGKGGKAPVQTPAPQQSPSQVPAQAPAPASKPSAAAAPPTEQKNTAPQPSTNTQPSNPSGKRGLAYNYQSPNLNIFTQYKNIAWAHNWDSNRAGLPAQFDYVPTLHSIKPDHTGQWDANVKKATASGQTVHLMSFNEPDMPDQARMTVAAAVAAFNQYLKPYAGPKTKLGSPSVSNGVGTNPATGQPQGLDWLRPFLQQCAGCPISFVPVHWYGCPAGACSVDQDVASFKKAMTDAMNVAVVDGKRLPVWIPEFQCLGDANKFLGEVLPWLDQQAQIERYSYFMVQEGILVQGGGVSGLGVKFATG